MTLKFMKQWAKKLDATLPPDSRALLSQAVCFFKLVSHPTDDAFLKDTRLHDLLLDLYLESPCPFLPFLDLSPSVRARALRSLLLVLAALEVKLGYLVDEGGIPQALVFTPEELQLRGELGRVVVEKLSKVKGRKVRRAVSEGALQVVDGLAERCRLRGMRGEWTRVVGEMIEVEVSRYINCGVGQVERIVFAIDQMKNSMLGAKLLVLQLVKKKQASQQITALLDESEILKVLDRMNLNQVSKIVPGIFKPKFFCCLSHHAYRKAFEDNQWLSVENQAINQMMLIEDDRKFGRKQCITTLIKIIKEAD